ncbi:unnamed protein product [Cyprideis torosa]|uniref:Uncharacterized protein n=1 Tax=Cyprideis torosa TaxID=163714 RepID=A0A7R8WUN6_9CRUS|nr:unnamed protein product [Cyprideis torosa]CAG0905824.1 unnamed protein product [Cyprideis torosa]
MRIVDCYARYDGHGQTMVMIVMSHKMKFLSDDVIIPSDFNMGEGQEVRGEIFRSLTFHSGVPAAWILSRFSDYNCPGLKNKPKVFIFQTARALDHNPAYFEGTVPEDWREIANPNFSEESPGCTRHYAVLKSCIEGGDDDEDITEVEAENVPENAPEDAPEDAPDVRKSKQVHFDVPLQEKEKDEEKEQNDAQKASENDEAKQQGSSDESSDEEESDGEECTLTEDQILDGIDQRLEIAEPKLLTVSRQWNNGVRQQTVEVNIQGKNPDLLPRPT